MIGDAWRILGRARRAIWRGSARGGTGSDLVRLGRVAAKEGRYADAATLYGEALRLDPAQPRLRVQAGHMAKEAADLETAEAHYLAAAAAMPDDADLALQLGHFYKVAGRVREAEESYHRALALKPNWDMVCREIDHLDQLGLHGARRRRADAPARSFSDAGGDPSPTAVVASSFRGELLPDLLPRSPTALLHRHGESIHLRRCGQPEQGAWGLQRTLRGVQALRGLCISADPIVELHILLNGQMIHRGPVQPFGLHNEMERPDLRKYVFNVWIDFSDFLPGRYHIEFYFRDARGTRDEQGGRRSSRDYVVVAPPLTGPMIEGGDAWTPSIDPTDPRSVEEQVNARPSMIRSAERSIIEGAVENLLILRTDQLGDVVVSVPAFRRIRALYPAARIVCLATSANAELIRTLGVVDEVIEVPFPDDPVQRRRVMLAADQEALARRLRAYCFDLAIDLAPAGESRPLLLLSGAKVLVGMGHGAWPWLTAAFDVTTRDPAGRSDVLAASSKTLAMVESLPLLHAGKAEVVRRSDLSRDLLANVGLGGDERFAILHTGARVVASRWPHYPALAQRLLEAEPDLYILMLAGDAEPGTALPPALLTHPRFRLIDRRLTFDTLDAMVSYCALFVGNDSGPKHLAALRGANVVSLHLARTNWGEWGQDQGGVIISRQVPCAACHIYHDPEECGKDFVCITRIAVDEVVDAALVQLRRNPAKGSSSLTRPNSSAATSSGI